MNFGVEQARLGDRASSIVARLAFEAPPSSSPLPCALSQFYAPLFVTTLAKLPNCP